MADEVDVPLPEDPPPVATQTPDEAIRGLGFDPAAIKALVVTSAGAIAIAVDYPEPYTPPEPQEAS